MIIKIINNKSNAKKDNLLFTEPLKIILDQSKQQINSFLFLHFFIHFASL